MQRSAFETTDGVSVSAVSAAEMRDVDRVAIDEFGLALLPMMETAGRNLAMRARAFDPGSVTVVAGSGGNGGGGLACARHLANHGVPVVVVLDRHPDELDGPAARQHRPLDTMGVEVRVGPTGIASSELVIDALVGYGLDGPLRGTASTRCRTVGNETTRRDPAAFDHRDPSRARRRLTARSGTGLRRSCPSSRRSCSRRTRVRTPVPVGRLPERTTNAALEVVTTSPYFSRGRPAYSPPTSIYRGKPIPGG